MTQPKTCLSPVGTSGPLGVNKCDIEVHCVNSNGENVVTSNLNLIHFFNIQNCKNWVQKQSSYVIFVKRCLNCPQNEILHICHLIYQNGMN
jgi:hypothetical protein